MSSITPSPYFPASPEAPLLREKHEIQANCSISTAGATANGTYAITDQIGMIGKASFSSNKPDGHDGHQASAELGIGLFDSGKDGGTCEVYSGCGWGESRYSWQDFSGPYFQPILISGTDQSINFLNAWLQVDAGWTGRIAAFAVLARVNYVNVYRDLQTTTTYHDIDPGFYLGGPPKVPYSESYMTATHVLYLTPGVEARVGYEHIYLEGIVYLLIGFSGLNSNAPPGLGSLGLVYRF